MIAATFSSGAFAAEPGVTAQTVVIGMSTPLTGANSVYGSGLMQGLQLGFARLNDAGGVGGKRLTLQVLDDAGDANKALENTRALISSGVFALTGFHGARSVESILPLLDQTQTPLIGAASSAESLREPARRGLFNLRAGAFEESAAMVYQLDTIGMGRIAAIGRDDGLGRAGLEAIKTELMRLSIRPVAIAELTMQSGPPEMARASRKICEAQPDAVLLALDARTALEAIRALRAASCMPQFYVMSETGADLAAQGNVQASELSGVVVSQVLPSPENLGSPLVAELRRELSKYPTIKPSYPILEGYLYARTLGEALRFCGRTVLTRECVIDALESNRVDVPGYRLSFGPQNRRGSKFVELTLMDARGGLRR